MPRATSLAFGFKTASLLGFCQTRMFLPPGQARRDQTAQQEVSQQEVSHDVSSHHDLLAVPGRSMTYYMFCQAFPLGCTAF